MIHVAAVIGWLLLALTGCNLGDDPQRPTAPPPTLTPGPAPTATPTDARWTVVQPGLEMGGAGPQGDLLGQLQVVRLDPAHFTFRAHYRPGDPLTLSEWEDVLPGAAVIVNANFFTPEQTVIGLLVSGGTAYGQPLVGRGGTFAVEAGTPRLWSNRTRPYAGQPLQEVVQAFPMLVENGVHANTDPRQRQRSRRTVVALDHAGRVLLMVTPTLGLSLYDLGAYLPEAGLNITHALNLDGGGSTMMAVPPADYRLRSLDPVPAVLAAYPRP